MEVDEIQMQGCNKMSRQKGDELYPDDEEDGEVKRMRGAIDGGSAGLGRLCGWPTSRIVRVSRASGGKDRHSKVWTSKGLRDRRVRLSVHTAIQFYDLQDRLGYDQPSKAVEWLLSAAASSIDELPSINTSFLDTPKQMNDIKRFDLADAELDGGEQNYQQQQHISLSKSACSSTSETSKGSSLSLARSENRIKARERARERAAKEKEKENEACVINHPNVNPISQTSFTELLTGGIGSIGNSNTSPSGSAQQNHRGGESNMFHKSTRQWSSAPMDYFASELLDPSSSRTHHSSSGFPGQIHLGNSLPQSMTIPPFSVGDHHPEQQHFSFVPDHLVSVAAPAGGGDYNLNFTISSGVTAGFNRGTLQSNSPSLMPYLQRFSSVDGSNVPFFIGTAASNAAAMENNHHFPPGLDGRLQLYYRDSGQHSDQKGKGKN